MVSVSIIPSLWENGWQIQQTEEFEDLSDSTKGR